MADNNQTQARGRCSGSREDRHRRCRHATKVVAETKTSRSERAKTARRVKRRARPRQGRCSTRRSQDAPARPPPPRKAAPEMAARRAAQERIETVTNNNFFKGFEALPAFAPFQNLFADANERGQEVAERGQKVAEELADLTRANVEAIVEAGRVASRRRPRARPGRRRDQPRGRREDRRRDPLPRGSQVADRVPAAAGRVRSRSFDRFVAEELEADRIDGQAGRRSHPADFEPRHGECRALQHARCLTHSPSLVQATLSGRPLLIGRPSFLCPDRLRATCGAVRGLPYLRQQ